MTNIDDDEYDDSEPNQVNPNPSNNVKEESEPELIPVRLIIPFD